jgi:hypothetical protein
VQNEAATDAARAEVLEQLLRFARALRDNAPAGGAGGGAGGDDGRRQW